MSTARIAAGQKEIKLVLLELAVSAHRIGPQQHEQHGMRRSRMASRDAASGSKLQHSQRLKVKCSRVTSGSL
eukprot:Skav211590  [mRNA]  locus=scaffold2962:24600:24815:+ [translate_table: standard]